MFIETLIDQLIRCLSQANSRILLTGRIVQVYDKFPVAELFSISQLPDPAVQLPLVIM